MNAMNILSVKLDEDLLTELECPVCLEYMLPPITVCENGHKICDYCKPKLRHCHTCRGPMLKVRSESLEHLAQQVELPCRFRNFGCTVTLNVDLMKDHQRDCPQMRYNCPMIQGKHLHCPWECRLEGMKEHLKTTHSEKFHEVNDTLSITTKLARKTAYDCIMHAMGEIFYVITETDCDEVYGCVQYVGQRKSASKYKYEFSLEKMDKTDKISVCHTTRSSMVRRHDIYKKGRCFRVKFNECKHLMDSDSVLGITVNISKNVRAK
jgi:E3 ubiquitin-protein ligase SIAH1